MVAGHPRPDFARAWNLRSFHRNPALGQRVVDDVATFGSGRIDDNNAEDLSNSRTMAEATPVPNLLNSFHSTTGLFVFDAKAFMGDSFDHFFVVFRLTQPGLRTRWDIGDGSARLARTVALALAEPVQLGIDFSPQPTVNRNFVTFANTTRFSSRAEIGLKNRVLARISYTRKKTPFPGREQSLNR